MDAAHQNRLTRFLLAVAFATEAPIQEQLVMKEIDFGAGGSGKIPEEVGPIVSPPLFLLDDAAIERIRASYSALAESGSKSAGRPTRRYLMARTERVRPSDPDHRLFDRLGVDDLAALRRQAGQGTGRLLGVDLAARKEVESDHKCSGPRGRRLCTTA